MRILRQFQTPPHPCPYLPDREARLEYLYTPRLTGAEYERLMDRGYRKFGPLPFHPVCPHCTACRPIRIPLDAFRPDRSQRRNWKRNQDLEVRCAEPSLDEDRLALYHRYHAAQTERKDWPPSSTDGSDYTFSFLSNSVPAQEITLWLEGRLVAVVLTELTPRVISGVYHYHEPELAERGLGVYGMLQTLELGRRLDKKWAYFGYYVAGCPSLEYKARFRPCELMDEQGIWRPFPDPVPNQ
ncbi:MAG: arginyltransferase [Armatimonadetes bacterium]|nr:arginyltransferase [Armatimonadota bacterium]